MDVFQADDFADFIIDTHKTSSFEVYICTSRTHRVTCPVWLLFSYKVTISDIEDKDPDCQAEMWAR
jgi:hypothetical protein